MKPDAAKTEFLKRLSNASLRLSNMTPDQGIEAMLSFYKEERADGCSFENDADMLLFQWGTYDWENNKIFNLDITRQLIFGGSDDENIWQLSLTFKFIPTDPLRNMDPGDKWCGALGDVAEFCKFIHDSQAFQLLADQTPDKVELEYECAG